MNFSNSPRDVHIDQLLSNVAINYRPHNMIADQIAPIVSVGKQSDHYTIFSRAEMLTIEDTLRAPGQEANIITRSTTSETYYANNYALKDFVTIEDKANADPIFVQKLLNGRAGYIMNKIWLDWENRIATQVTNTSNVGSTSAVASAWNDLDNSDPLGDIETGLYVVQDATGVRPNKIIFGEQGWRNVRRNTAIRNLIKGTNNGGGYATLQQVADLLDVEQVLVGGAYKNTGNEAQAEVLSSIWGDNVLMHFTPSAPSMDEPAFMYSFRWQGNGLPSMAAERHPYNSRTHSEEVEIGYYQDEKITGAEYSHLLVGVNSSQ